MGERQVLLNCRMVTAKRPMVFNLCCRVYRRFFVAKPGEYRYARQVCLRLDVCGFLGPTLLREPHGEMRELEAVRFSQLVLTALLSTATLPCCLRVWMMQSPRYLHRPGVHRHRGRTVQGSERRGDGGARRGVSEDVRPQPVESGDVRQRQDYESSRGLLRGEQRRLFGQHTGRRHNALSRKRRTY